MKALGLFGAMALLACTPAFGGIIVYNAILTGAGENPPNASPATGTSEVDFDNILQTLRVRVAFTGLSTPDTVAHIHCCIAPPATTAVAVPFVGFPSGVTSGTYDHTFDLTLTTTYDATFLSTHGGTAATAEAALLAGISSVNAYVNVHSTAIPGGEIRGFLVAAPEPGTWAFLGTAMLAMLFVRHRGRPA